jgi:hypothetical protein
MNIKSSTTIDFVVKGLTADEWRIVLVEVGPWSTSTEAQLKRIQERLYGCIDAALDGKLAEEFPESNGKKIVIQLDCYNVPVPQTAEFFERFSNGVFSTGDYREALKKSPIVKGVSFEVNFDSIN